VNQYLLDTHTLIWWVDNSDKISPKVRKILSNASNICYFSLASSWEMSIKSSIGKLKLSVSVCDYVVQHLSLNDFKQLNITLNHVTAVESLPWHHRDPFDRLLLAQAIQEKLVILSADKMFDRYDIKRIW
jgi:PIN domain nuclease of toxin-antitoxin system